jgi:DNA invertase Pin-like site-specific DNA recombinase
MKAFVYLRLSVDKEDGRAQSIDAQRYEIELYAKSKGYEIVGEFVDSGVSGRKIIPTCNDHNPLAHLRCPMVIMRQG